MEDTIKRLGPAHEEKVREYLDGRMMHQERPQAGVPAGLAHCGVALNLVVLRISQKSLAGLGQTQ